MNIVLGFFVLLTIISTFITKSFTVYIFCTSLCVSMFLFIKVRKYEQEYKKLNK